MHQGSAKHRNQDLGNRLRMMQPIFSCRTDRSMGEMSPVDELPSWSTVLSTATGGSPREEREEPRLRSRKLFEDNITQPLGIVRT